MPKLLNLMTRSPRFPVTQTQNPSVALNALNICVLPPRPRYLVSQRLSPLQRPVAALSQRCLLRCSYFTDFCHPGGWSQFSNSICVSRAGIQNRHEMCFAQIQNISKHKADHDWLLREAFCSICSPKLDRMLITCGFRIEIL